MSSLKSQTILFILFPEPGPTSGTQQALHKCWLDKYTNIDFQTQTVTVAFFFPWKESSTDSLPHNSVMHFLASSPTIYGALKLLGLLKQDMCVFLKTNGSLNQTNADTGSYINMKDHSWLPAALSFTVNFPK